MRLTRTVAKIAVTGVLIAGASMVAAQPAAANSTSVAPATQSRAYGATFSWTGTWTGTPNFRVAFNYGNGDDVTLINSTSAKSRSFSHIFYPCGNSTYTQYLTVRDTNNLITQGTAKSTVSGGGAC